MLCIPEMLGIPVIGLVAAGKAVFGAESVVAGAVENVEAMVGVTVMIGTATAELTPRLLISVEPIGMPARGTPPGVVGAVGDDDAPRLFAPAPHMLWVPDVSISAEVMALCGVTVPTDMPPPSKLAADPNIVDGAVPMVEHTALPMSPVEGSGIGLTPGEVISVAPNGMPLPPTGALGTMPSGDVTESEGVGITVACCAKAWLHSSTEAVVIIRKSFMGVLRGEASSARHLAAAQWQGLVRMQGVPVVAIGITAVIAVSRTVSAEAMRGVLVQSEIMRADMAAGTHATANASHVLATKASASKAADVTATAETSTVTASTTAAGVGRTGQQARSEKCGC
jgi:hypothetical protein